MKPFVVNPNITTRHDGVSYSDVRSPSKIAPRMAASSIVPTSRIVGVWPGGLAIALPEGQTAAQLIAGITKLHLDVESVNLVRFEMNPDFGIWANRTFFDIAADVRTRNGKTYSIVGRGENLMVNLTPANFQIALDRALESYRENVRMIAQQEIKP